MLHNEYVNCIWNVPTIDLRRPVTKVEFSSLQAMLIQNLIGLLFSLSYFIPFRSILLCSVGEEWFKFYCFSVLNLIKHNRFIPYCLVVCSHHPMTLHNVLLELWVIGSHSYFKDRNRSVACHQIDRGLSIERRHAHCISLQPRELLSLLLFRYFFFYCAWNVFSVLLLREFPRGPEWCNGCRQFGTNFD